MYTYTSSIASRLTYILACIHKCITYIHIYIYTHTHETYRDGRQSRSVSRGGVPYAGLRNEGATCYLNAVMQVNLEILHASQHIFFWYELFIRLCCWLSLRCCTFPKQRFCCLLQSLCHVIVVCCSRCVTLLLFVSRDCCSLQALCHVIVVCCSRYVTW